MVKFDPKNDIPDLSGKVIIITGANIGLGYETLNQLAQHSPAHIYLAARSTEKAESAISSIREAQPNACPITHLPLDLTSFSSIESAAKTFLSSNKRLDVLINNAGIMATPPGLTKEGYEIQFGTNHVGHALFTKLLLPTLKSTSASHPTDPARIVTLSSAAERMAPSEGIKFDTLKDASCNNMGTWTRYGQSKLANILYTRSLAKENPDVVCVSLHPGGVATNLTQGPVQSYGSWLSVPAKVIGWLFLTPVAKGAWGQTWAAVAPIKKEGESGEGVTSGTFYWPVGVEGRDSKLAKNKELEEKLWDWTKKELEAWEGKKGGS